MRRLVAAFFFKPRSFTLHAVKFLFWTNVFDPEIVKQVGEKFLLQSPGRVTLPEDGGILLASRDRFTKCLQRPEQASVAYLAKKFPGIQRFRSTGVKD